MNELIVLKVGGSVCTEKEKGLLEVRKEVLERVGREIAKAREEKKFKLIIVHGAGPFGHKIVEEERLEMGVKSEEQVKGFIKVHRSMQELNNIVLKELGKNLNCFKVQPSASIVQSGKKIFMFDTKIVEKLLELNVIPVLHGDMVVDNELGASVVSGDAIVGFLAKKLSAEKVFFGVNVDGVISGGPVVERIDENNFEEVLETVGKSKAEDVTGGMKGKLLEIKENLAGMETVIFNMLEKERTYKHLIGRKEIGTEIKL